MQIGENAGFARLDDMLEKAAEVAGAGTAGVDQRGHAAAASRIGRVDTERGAAPIDMGVKVDEPRSDKPPADVTGFGRFARLDGMADRRDAAIVKGNIGYPVQALRGID